MTSKVLLHPTTESMLKQFLSSSTHAVLLVGTTGLGKTHIAKNLAAQLLGVDETTLLNQAYYRELKASKDAITIDQVRQLIAFFRLVVPGNADIKRVAVLQDADKLGREAQNALLKLLEEPPEKSVLLLTTSRPQSLLPTVRSRLQDIVIQTPNEKALIDHFVSLGHAEPTVRRALLRSGGDVAATTRLLEESIEQQDESLSLVKKALGGNSYERLLLVDSLAKQKEQAAEFVNTLLQVALVSIETAATSSAASVERWYGVLRAGHTAQSSLDGNGNTKLVLTDLMLSL